MHGWCSIKYDYIREGEGFILCLHSFKFNQDVLVVEHKYTRQTRGGERFCIPSLSIQT